jgi:hypothetical protein
MQKQPLSGSGCSLGFLSSLCSHFSSPSLLSLSPSLSRKNIKPEEGEEYETTGEVCVLFQ